MITGKSKRQKLFIERILLSEKSAPYVCTRAVRKVRGQASISIKVVL
jgi:hypothetical protein